MLKIVPHKDLFSDFLWFKLEKELQEMHYFPNHFPVTLEKKPNWFHLLSVIKTLT